MTAEETSDKLQSSLMKGWKSAQFNIPTVLKGTRLAGSAHDKNKAEYDLKRKSLCLAHFRNQTHSRSPDGSKITHKAKNTVQ